MTMVNQSYMGRGWSSAEMSEARNEESMANPPWSREGAGAFAAHNHKCEPCGVLWRTTDEFSVCWNCGQAPVHKASNYWPSTLTSPYVQREWEYTGQPTTPDSGCGCSDDPTVEMVAKLHADGWDLWSACLLVYRDAA